MSLLLRVLLLCLASALPMLAVATRPLITASTAARTLGVNGGVTFSATVTANDALASVFFEYGKTSAYGTKTVPAFISADGVDEPVTTPVTGLVGGRVYHFRAVAENDVGRRQTDDAIVTVASFAPALTSLPATGVVSDRTTLKGTITANGSEGVAFFEYATTISFDAPVPTPEVEVHGSEEAHPLTAAVVLPARDQTFHFRLVFRPDVGDDVRSSSLTVHTNNVPVARADAFNLRGRGATSLAVLRNDTDADGDPLLVSAATGATKGTATPTLDGASIAYVPGASFRGTDSFTYTVTDDFTATTPATATVTIRAFGVLLAGQHGGLLVDENGDAIGYFKISASESGAFTGSVLVNGEKESFSGIIGPDGKFRGAVKIDGKTVSLALDATVSGDATTLDVSFDDGRWTAALRTTEASPALRADSAGRYTVEFPGGTATSDPGNAGGDPTGTGWAVLKLSEDGVARVKGRLADGRSFSTRGVLGVATTGAVVTFFDDPRRTRVAGTLTLGDAVGGTLLVQREPGGSGNFSDGYGIASTTSGARYIPPGDGKRVIEGKSSAGRRELTFAVTGGDPGEDFTRQVRLDKDNGVKVIDGGAEGLKLKIDRDGGRFLARFTGATDDQRLKGTGVFIQGASATALTRGAGVFTGQSGTGTITITVGGGTTTGTTSGTGTIQVTP